ncbi:MAG: CHRD domain-containing protein [Ilumatobacteraceae bacterium]
MGQSTKRLSKKHLFIPFAAVIGVSAGMITNVVADSGARTSPSGEPSVPLVAHLKGGNEEVPNPGNPDGSGFALVNVSPANNNEVCVELTTRDIGEWAAAHIHEAGVGEAGPVVVDFEIPAAGTGPELTHCVEVDPADLDVADLIDFPADYYVNVHTADFPGGAVRGQLAARSSETQFNPVPDRVYDSRGEAAGKIAADETRMIDLELPAGVRAGIITVTVAETEVGGFLTVYAAGEPLPASSTVNWTADDQAVATTTFAAVDADGMISITAGQNATHVIVDVIGFVI